MLIRNRKQVLLKALSLWCVYLAGFLEILPYIVPYLDNVIPRWASLVLLALAPFARLIKQDNLATGGDDAETKD